MGNSTKIRKPAAAPDKARPVSGIELPLLRGKS